MKRFAPFLALALVLALAVPSFAQFFSLSIGRTRVVTPFVPAQQIVVGVPTVQAVPAYATGSCGVGVAQAVTGGCSSCGVAQGGVPYSGLQAVPVQQAFAPSYATGYGAAFGVGGYGTGFGVQRAFVQRSFVQPAFASRVVIQRGIGRAAFVQRNVVRQPRVIVQRTVTRIR